MQEIITNIHVHSVFSDGSGTYQDIIKAAFTSEIDVLIITDHNVRVKGIENYYILNNKKLLLLIGEEVHDKSRIPQKNHLLALGIDKELSNLAHNTQHLINTINHAEGLSFLAHPFETDLPQFDEPDITWVDWTIKNYTGLELWNQLSEFKSVSNSLFSAVIHAFFPKYIAHKPDKETIIKWDELTSQGERIVTIGGSDSHALNMKYGPLKKTIFPYEFHFRGINTHLLIQDSLSYNFSLDKAMVIDALRKGHCFIGYDWPASTKGFRFSAQNRDQNVIMGDRIQLNSPVTLGIITPQNVNIRLLKNGKLIKEWKNEHNCFYSSSEIGTYRVECYINYLGKSRGWIFSNPIYIY